MKFIDLMVVMPSDTKQNVKDGRKKYNSSSSDSIRFETRLTLASDMEYSLLSEHQKRTAHVKVPIRGDHSYPAHHRQFKIPDNLTLAAFVSQIQPNLQRFIE